MCVRDGLCETDLKLFKRLAHKCYDVHIEHSEVSLCTSSVYTYLLK